ncbi:MAG: gluconate 2-dehydrogenase subunit 3 family protein [Bryobacteraceae bacterium]
MHRRDLLKLGAAVAAAPAGSAQHHPAGGSSDLQSTNWKPLLFDTHQDQTVVALADQIIPATDTPGAKAALVNRYIDKLLHDGPARTQEAFLSGLAWLDGYAIRKHSRPFVRCSAAQQAALLETLSDSEGEDATLEPGRTFFRIAKGIIARTYYATQTGFNELNKGGRVPSTFACKHPEHA